MVAQTIADKPTSSKAEPSTEDLTEIEELMSNGKRHLICNEPQVALECFVDVCEKLATFYGQTGDECAEAYLYYGKTLLEIARLENGVLGHAVKETPVLGEEGDDTETDTKTEDEEEEISLEKRSELRANVNHAMREGNLYNEASTEEEESEDEGDSAESKEEKDKTSEQSTKEATSSTTDEPSTSAQTTTTGEGDKDAATTTTGEGDAAMDEDVTEEEEEEVSNMQLSWEMFELTSFICNRQVKRATSKDLEKPKSMLAEAKYGLAQISLESEHYEEAIKDFTTCVDLYKEVLEDKNDRRIAEVYYNIGLALSFDKKFTEAIVQYKLAMTIMEARIKTLEEKVKKAEETGDKEKASSELEEWTKEIGELKDIVVLDMITKIEDAEDMKKQAEVSIQTMKDAAKEMFSAVKTSGGFDQGFDEGFGTECKESKEDGVQDISHKIRSSKRKPDDEEAPSTIDVKKVKKDTTNGHSNGTSNGHVNGKSNGHTNGQVTSTEA